MEKNAQRRIYSKEYAYNIIRKNIVSCVYVPGEFLNETFLSQELGVSRTPIREALSLLERENLVAIFPKRGIQVTDITVTDINEIYQVRELLEPYIIALYAKDIDKSKLLDIRRLLQLQNVEEKEDPQAKNEEQYSIDSDLHQTLLAANKNRYFATALDNVYMQNQRVRILTGRRSSGRLLATRDEHIKIVEAILLENYEEATHAMRTHLRASKEAAIRSLLW